MAATRDKVGGAAVRLGDRRVLVGGGGASAELFDPSADRFTRVPGAPGTADMFASAVRLTGGDALVLGGYDEANRTTDRVWRLRR